MFSQAIGSKCLMFALAMVGLVHGAPTDTSQIEERQAAGTGGVPCDKIEMYTTSVRNILDWARVGLTRAQ